MLSVLIPVYNFDVRAFIANLAEQLTLIPMDCEIIVADDFSNLHTREVNKQIEKIHYVRYIELPENYGRAKIRNFLAREAKFDYLLFCDCDSAIVSTSFIKRYVDICSSHKVICGGRLYDETPPENTNKLLHWRYGVKREQTTANVRNMHPNQSFMTNNFVIRKDVLLSINFDENLKQYGHEDTLFGFELKKQNITIHHIDNQLIHVDIEDASAFLEKTKHAISNLLSIYHHIDNKQELNTDVKLLSYHAKIVKFRLNKPFACLFNLVKSRLEKNILGKSPSLLLFDLYKLGLLSHIYIVYQE